MQAAFCTCTTHEPLPGIGNAGTKENVKCRGALTFSRAEAASGDALLLSIYIASILRGRPHSLPLVVIDIAIVQMVMSISADGITG